jgi:hypothetical protein
VDKKEDASDKAELDRVLMWKNSICAKQALTEKFQDKDSKKNQ